METTFNPNQDRTNITDKGYTFGGKNYAYETRYDANNMPYTVDVQKDVPTVVSNYGMNKEARNIGTTYQNYANTTIPSFTAGKRTAVYAPTDSTSGETGAFLGYAANEDERNALLSGTITSSGVQFNQPEGAILQPDGNYLFKGQYYTKDQLSSPENIAAIQNASLQRKKYDEALQTELDNINKRYDMYKRQQEAINQSGAAGARNALLQSGAGGRGSVSQFAAATADSRVNSILSDGEKALADLDIKRNELLSAARIAYESKDYELLANLNTQIETNRKEMLAQTKKTNEELAKETKRAKLDAEIADLYSSGVSDVPSILKQLKNKGVIATAKDIEDTLQNIIPEGLDDLMKTLRTNGAPIDVIQKVMSSGNMADAYKAAGNYAAGGTGIIGEYNFYRAQAEAKGQVPVDFDTYQTIDANRKAKIAGAGVGGAGTPKTYSNDLDAFLDNVVNIIPSKFGQETFKASMTKARDDSDKIRTAAAVVLKNSPATVKEAFANQAVGMKEIDKAIALIDKGTKSGALQAGRQYVYNVVGKDYDPNLAAISGHITAAIQPYRSIITGAAWGDQEDAEYASLFGTTKYEPQELKSRLLRVKEIMREKSVQGLSSQVDPFGTGTNFFETTGDMQKKLLEEGAKNPLQIDVQNSTVNRNPLNI